MKSFTKLKKITSIIVFGLSVLFFIILVLSKNKLNEFASQAIKLETGSIVKKEMQQQVDSLYNYAVNEIQYEITFLEFGAKGCSACKRMETVMDKVRNKYPNKVNLVFMNILKPESQDLMKYYGIAAIPTQILLNKDGKEYFRHTGYFSLKELTNKIIIKDQN